MVNSPAQLKEVWWAWKASIGLAWIADPEVPEAKWEGLYRAGGYAALLIAVLLVGEFVVYATLPNPITVVEHFELFIDDSLSGLLIFDLLSMVSYVLFVPTSLALYRAVRRESGGLIRMAMALFLVGVADSFATNTGFSMFSLNKQYALATTEAEREVLLAAGKTMITFFKRMPSLSAT